ncbi:MAG: NAD(P)H-dependent oxidoreductase subunit E [Anaerolineales bacterium]|nr:NAD(P)H-dependent oxidoreductase subunit E [Anaerolineales bacterium]
MTTTLQENEPLQIPAQREIIDQIINEQKKRPGAVMVILNELQNKIGFISEPMQAYVAKQLRTSIGSIHGVVTFYSFFTTQPRGKHTIKFCMGTACYVGGIPQLIDKAKQVTGVGLGETTPDRLLTLEACRCVGACSQAPVVTIDDEVIGRVRPNKFPQLVNKLRVNNAH